MSIKSLSMIFPVNMQIDGAANGKDYLNLNSHTLISDPGLILA
jgi:hypothetical protein